MTAALTVLFVVSQLLFTAAPVAQPVSGRALATSSAVTTANATGSWTVYHRDDGHTGFDPTMPSFGAVNVGWTSPSLSQSIRTEPLVYNGLVYAGAMDNTVYALRQWDGTIQWSVNLGAPQTSGWGCGNINPTGILGTPVIDTSTNRLYVVAFLNATLSYWLFGLDLATGATKLQTEVKPTGFDWTIEQQRGAIALANGNVYVPFGGRDGDCGAYHGYIVAVPTSGAPVSSWYQTPGQGAGFWSAGGVVVDDSTGKVFDTSGNGTSFGCDANPDGTPAFENDAIVRLSATLAHEDSFVPQDWKNDWCANDQDLGSASMVLINPTLAFQSGKWGTGFLVNPQSLGGMDGQLFPTPKPATYAEVPVCRGNNSDANFAGYAYAAPYVYIPCDGHGIVGVQVDTVAKTFTACGSTCSAPSFDAADGTTLGPPIVAGGAVWAVSTSGQGIYAFNPTTGAVLYHNGTFSAPRFSSPSSAGDQVFFSTGNQIRSFVMVSGVASTPFLSYPTQALTTTSTAQLLTLTNGTGSSITVSAVNLGGSSSSEFAKGTDTCSGQVVAAAGTCTVQYTFTPTDNGVRNATVTFVNTGPDNPTSALVGIGGASEAATRLYFPWYDHASPGVNADTIHITNPSGVVATGTISLTGANSITFNVGPGQDGYFAFPAGTIGGPVVMNSVTVPVISSLRAWYYQSFNETPARTAADAATTLYFPWYDHSSPGVNAATIHITNPSGTTATGTVVLSGATTLPFSVVSGADTYVTFPQGTIGGPVTVTSTQPVIASLRAWYYQSFNETLARPESAAATSEYFPWYDLASTGVRADTIHITNESGTTATGTIALGATSMPFSVNNGEDKFFVFPGGTIGGPVTITSTQPVLTSLRAWYYQSFNEVPGRPATPSSATQYFPWYDHFSPGVNADTIHITNPGGVTVTGTISKVGDTPISFSVMSGQDLYFAFPGGSIGGPVTISSSAAVIVSLRAWYYQSFNEVPGTF